MLTQIHIRDFATIEELHLNLPTGCTILTGETGAGKSIFIEAIELALGGRTSQTIIRLGKDKTDISLCFDITHFPHVIARLKENDLYLDNTDCIIRRIIMNDGRSRCYVNNTPVTVHLVKELGELLFHLHGQHEQQVLIKADEQREMLDKYSDHLSLANEVKLLAERNKAIKETLQQLRDKADERCSRIEYLRFQLEELETIDLKEEEWEALQAEQKRLSHHEELRQTIQAVLARLTNEAQSDMLTNLHSIRRAFETIQNYEPKTKEWISTINTLLIQLSDLASQLKNYSEKTEIDPERIQLIEEKVSSVFNLSRKYKISPHALPVFKIKLRQELNSLNTSDEEIAKLEEEQKNIVKRYHEEAHKLTLSRKKSASKLQKEIMTTIRSLSLPHAEFSIALTKGGDPSHLSPHGNEKIAFLIKTNPDQPMQPLAKVISGGELSRLSLALHLALANQTHIPTLIFDEVDTGLSGAAAEKIGKLLRKLGETYQVFCVTHQAQVAACAHHHLLVEKQIVSNTTHTHLHLLNQEQKTREIARMLGGERITQKTIEHAKEVLQLS